MKSYEIDLSGVAAMAKEILKEFSSGVILLRGDLASGKTTLTKYIVESLGVKDAVTSPTFSLQQCYGDKIFHYDIYNKGLDNFISLGMLEELEKDGLHLVEWGDDELKRILLHAGFDVLEINIKKIDNNKREYKICTL